MSTHKNFDKICAVVLVLVLVLTGVLMAFGQSADADGGTEMGYEDKLFDTSSVHTINIVMDDWDEFISNAESEEYYTCTLEIDGETYKNVAIRGKGNTSLTKVASYGNDRYSFKVEFDRYDSALTYYGLDKLCLNNIIQDNTYMKDYLCYRLMAEMGVASPLCSYVYVSVNGSDWGLYLAVEGVEESFLQRNYGSDYGELYKPDSQSMGGGRGNGKEFDMDDFENAEDANDKADNAQPGGKGDMNSSDDTLLKYIDDDPDSYPNIFDNAKTDVSSSDKKRLIAALKTLSGDEPESAVDVDKVIRYFVVHNFVLNFDSYTGSMIHNYYLYESDGQLQMIPWDYNLAFGGFQSAGGATSLVNYPIDDPVSGDSIEDRPMLAWIFQNEEYTELYHKYFAELISTVFDSGDFAQEFDSVVQMISPYVESDPTKFCTYEEFETGVSTLREFCLLRAESISGQLDGSIGSTSDTQEQSTLVDAGSLQISDMGTMEGDGAGGGENAPQMPDNNSTGGTTPPDLPTANFDGSTPPDMPTGDSSSGDTGGTTSTPPAKPDGDSSSDSSGDGTNTPPQQPSGDSDSTSDGTNAPPEMPSGDFQPPDGQGGDGGSQSDTTDDQNGGGQGSAPNGEAPNGNNGGGNAPGAGGDNAGGAPNGTPNPGSESSISTSTLILSAVSILVLIVGLVIAALYKRRK